MVSALTLESFDDDAGTAPQSHPEHVRGFNEGIEAEKLRAQDEQRSLNSALVSAVSDAHFTFTEARQTVLAELAPLLNAITTHILPATQTLGLATTICEILTQAADAQLSTQPTIAIHPDQFDAVATALAEMLPSKVKIVPDPTLTSHAAWLNVNSHDSMIDFENTFAAVQTALRAYADPHERKINHG